MELKAKIICFKLWWKSKTGFNQEFHFDWWSLWCRGWRKSTQCHCIWKDRWQYFCFGIQSSFESFPGFWHRDEWIWLQVEVWMISLVIIQNYNFFLLTKIDPKQDYLLILLQIKFWYFNYVYNTLNWLVYFQIER